MRESKPFVQYTAPRYIEQNSLAVGRALLGCDANMGQAMTKTIASESHRLLEARLLISRPEDVFNELQKHGSQAESYWSLDALDQQLERSLLARNEPLIDLALARYATDGEIVGQLYEKACTIADTSNRAYAKGLRVACLSNHLVSVSDLASFPRDIIGAEATWKVLSDADDDEASALLQNPRIDSNLLKTLYTREEAFASLPEYRWGRLIAVSRSNPLFAESHQLDEAIFRLLEIAPPNESWRAMLLPLLERLHPTFAPPLNSLRHVLQRWSSDHTDEDVTKWQHYLSRQEEFRCLIAALYGGDKAILDAGRTSADVAIRCAFYGNAPLTLAEMKAVNAVDFERDHVLFSYAVLFNNRVLRHPEKRDVLEKEYPIDEDLYHRRCEHLRLPPLDQWREEERRKRGERESEKFRFLVVVGLGVLVGFAFIQEFDHAARSNDLIPVILWTVVWVLIVAFILRRQI